MSDLDTAAQAIAAAREPEEQAAPQQTAEVVDIQERRQPERAPDGKFQKADAKADTEAESADTETAEDDEDYLELEIAEEEGKEPKRERLKVSEVFQGFQRAKELEKEVETLKQAQPLPKDYEIAVEETVRERGAYLQALQQWAQFNQPQMPSRDLINPASPNYNPELYYQQMQLHDETVANQQRVAAEIEKTQKLQSEQQSQLQRSRLIREAEALKKVWPELKDKGTFEKVAKSLQDSYSVDADTLKSISDHRFYAIVKDALAFRDLQAAKKEAAKAIIGKPKLVRANARNNIDSKAAARESSFGKLAKTGSLDDAAAVIATLR